MKNYLLSTGVVTSRVEEYVLDLFKIYLAALPGDIPGRSDIGFEFNLVGVKKSELEKTMITKVYDLVSVIKQRFSVGVDIEVVSLDIISENLAKLVISVNSVADEIELNI